MRTINLDTWSRREHYQFFTTFEYPHFSLCANVDLTKFLPAIKAAGISFTGAIMYLIARTANTIPEFRHRVREGAAIEHEVVHPGVTILSKDDLFYFCTVEYDQDFDKFMARAEKEISHVKETSSLNVKITDDNLLFMSSIPWVSFTSFMHPLKLTPADSIPRFAWGKYFKEGKSTKIPLSVQGHHAVMDGIHAGKFYTEIQNLLSQPESYIGGV